MPSAPASTSSIASTAISTSDPTAQAPVANRRPRPPSRFRFQLVRFPTKNHPLTDNNSAPHPPPGSSRWSPRSHAALRESLRRLGVPLDGCPLQPRSHTPMRSRSKQWATGIRHPTLSGRRLDGHALAQCFSLSRSGHFPHHAVCVVHPQTPSTNTALHHSPRGTTHLKSKLKSSATHRPIKQSFSNPS